MRDWFERDPSIPAIGSPTSLGFDIDNEESIQTAAEFELGTGVIVRTRHGYHAHSRASPRRLRNYGGIVVRPVGRAYLIMPGSFGGAYRRVRGGPCRLVDLPPVRALLRLLTRPAPVRGGAQARRRAPGPLPRSPAQLRHRHGASRVPDVRARRLHGARQRHHDQKHGAAFAPDEARGAMYADRAFGSAPASHIRNQPQPASATSAPPARPTAQAPAQDRSNGAAPQP